MTLHPLYWSALVPAALLGAGLLRRHPRWRAAWLLAVSVAFLVWSQPSLWPLTLLMAGLAWLAPRGGRRAALAYAALAVALLAALKALRVAWPTGLSFVLLQGIAYALDVSAGRTNPGGFIEAMGYQLFFPKLTAGPLARFQAFRESFALPSPREEQLEQGLTLAVLGLARKLLIADRLRPLAMAGFSAHPHPLAGALTFATCGLYVYHDFAGATDMARGIALALGVELPENFNRPFAAVSLRDFWRRWHLSLSGFLRDYVYIPLGGNRRGRAAEARNVMTVFLVMGLWHGFTGPFLLFGLWHGTLTALEHLGVLRPERWPRTLARGYALAAIAAGFVIFLAPSLGSLARGFDLSYTAWQEVRLALSPLSIGALAVCAALPWLRRVRLPDGVRRLAVLTLLALCLARMMVAGIQPLLYAQF